MKNGLVIWNILLTLLSGYLLISQFTKKKTATPVDSRSVRSNDTTILNTSPASIAYFEMDSVEAHFQMVKDVQSEIQSKEKEYSNNLAGLDATYKKKVMGYQGRGNSMTPDEIQKAQIDLKQTEDYLKDRKQEFDQGFQEFVTRKNLSLKKKIEEFIALYNKDRKYSYIMVYEPGLFYYKDTSYNITAEVIKGLNESYAIENKK